MIKCHLSRILGAKRIKITELARQTGISRNTLFLIYHEKSAGVSYNTLDKICEALNCQPGDLLEYEK